MVVCAANGSMHTPVVGLSPWNFPGLVHCPFLRG
jgi:delta 1-pyrroline-5-carboxylate dehydrogenase